MNRERLHKPLHPALVVGFWMVIALALRLFRITGESLWWDEYTSHVYLNAPSLFDFLALNRSLDPLTLPVYYTFEYLFTRYVHDSVFALRLMSIGIGLATLPLAYLLGKRLYGRTTGYMTVALLAISPVHIHHSQGIRMYVVFIFLTLAVMWSFLGLLERSTLRLWLLHGMVSVLLYWTHPFAGLVPAVLGAFLLLTYCRRTRLFWCWTCLQGILFLPTVIYLSTVRFWPAGSTSQWIEKPSLASLGADLFFDDIAAFHWQFRMGDFAQRLGGLRMGIDVTFAMLIGAVLLYSVSLYLRRGAHPPGESSRESGVLLALWLLLPPLMLFVLSWTVRPCMFPRYTVHCIVPLYLTLGIAEASFRRKRLRTAVMILLVAGMFLQWLWLQPGPQRTDWRSAGLLLHEKTSENDIVLVESLLWRDVFEHNLVHMTPGPLIVPVAAAEKTPLLAAQSILCLGMLGKHPPGDVWVVIALRYFDPGPPVIYEQYLKRWGIDFERWFFPAIREVYVYKLKMPEAGTFPDSPAGLFERWDTVETEMPFGAGELDAYAKEAFGDLAMALAGKGRTVMAMEVLEGLFARDDYSRQLFGSLYDALREGRPPENHINAVKSLWQGYGFRDNGQTGFACRAFEKAVALDPGHAVVCLELGYERLALGRHMEAADAFSGASEADGRYRFLGNLIHALRNHDDVDGALAAVQSYRKGILAQSRRDYDAAVALLREATAADPRLDDAWTSLTFVLIVQRKIEEARQALDAYFTADNTPSPGAFGLMAVIYIARGEPEKALEYVDRAFAMDEAYAREFGVFFNALLRERNLEKTLAEMDALKARGTDLYPLLYEDIRNLLH